MAARDEESEKELRELETATGQQSMQPKQKRASTAPAAATEGARQRPATPMEGVVTLLARVVQASAAEVQGARALLANATAGLDTANRLVLTLRKHHTPSSAS